MWTHTYEHLRTWTNHSFTNEWNARLDLWSTGRTRDGKSQLRYALVLIPEPPEDLDRRNVHFEGEDFWPSPLDAIDSDVTAAGLLGFFSSFGESLRFSGADADVPNDLGVRQRKVLADVYEDLAVWASELDPQD